MRNIFKLFAVVTVTIALAACYQAPNDPAYLVGTWTHPDTPNVHTVYNADGTGRVYRLPNQTLLREIEWEYLGDGHIREISTPVHIGEGDQIFEHLYTFRVEGDQLIWTLEVEQFPGSFVDISFDRVE